MMFHYTLHIPVIIIITVIINFIILLLLKESGNARLWDSNIHQINPKSPARQYKPIERKKRNERQ